MPIFFLDSLGYFLWNETWGAWAVASDESKYSRGKNDSSSGPNNRDMDAESPIILIVPDMRLRDSVEYGIRGVGVSFD